MCDPREALYNKKTLRTNREKQIEEIVSLRKKLEKKMREGVKR